MNLKQQRFADEYLVDGNATRAYKAAGYTAKNDNVAHAAGAKLLHVATIAAYIAERRKALCDKLEVTQERVLKEIARLAFSDMRKFATWGPGGVKLVDSSTLDEHDARCVAEVSETTTEHGGSLRFKLHDKKGALELLGRHLGMFVDKHEIKNIGALTNEELDAEIKRVLVELGIATNG